MDEGVVDFALVLHFAQSMRGRDCLKIIICSVLELLELSSFLKECEQTAFSMFDK